MTLREEVMMTKSRKVTHKRIYNGTTVCKPMAEGSEAEKMETTWNDSEVTCKKCRRCSETINRR